MLNKLFPVVVVGILAVAILQDIMFSSSSVSPVSSFSEPVEPNWSAISAWPALEAVVVEASPDPNRRITAIVLDDSGSMGSDIEDAKAAIVAALGAMDDNDRVGGRPSIKVLYGSSPQWLMRVLVSLVLWHRSRAMGRPRLPARCCLPAQAWRKRQAWCVGSGRSA